MSLYQAIANCNLQNASSTALGILDVLDLRANRGDIVAGIMVILFALQHKYNCSIPDLMQVIENMETRAIEEKIPEFSAAIQFIQGEL